MLGTQLGMQAKAAEAHQGARAGRRRGKERAGNKREARTQARADGGDRAWAANAFTHYYERFVQEASGRAYDEEYKVPLFRRENTKGMTSKNFAGDMRRGNKRAALLSKFYPKPMAPEGGKLARFDDCAPYACLVDEPTAIFAVTPSRTVALADEGDALQQQQEEEREEKEEDTAEQQEGAALEKAIPDDMSFVNFDDGTELHRAAGGDDEESIDFPAEIVPAADEGDALQQQQEEEEEEEDTAIPDHPLDAQEIPDDIPSQGIVVPPTVSVAELRAAAFRWPRSELYPTDVAKEEWRRPSAAKVQEIFNKSIQSKHEQPSHIRDEYSNRKRMDAGLLAMEDYGPFRSTWNARRSSLDGIRPIRGADVRRAVARHQSEASFPPNKASIPQNNASSTVDQDIQLNIKPSGLTTTRERIDNYRDQMMTPLERAIALSLPRSHPLSQESQAPYSERVALVRAAMREALSVLEDATTTRDDGDGVDGKA